MKTLEESKFSSRVSFAFQTVLCTVRQREVLAAQERLLALKYLLYYPQHFTATNAGFFNSFYKRPPKAD